jgi:predicted RNase H-like nuclease (RuvC/YqgF family)
MVVLAGAWQEERIMDDQERIARLEKEIAELEARLPAHSTPPAMLIELEELEEELAALRARVRRGQD